MSQFKQKVMVASIVLAFGAIRCYRKNSKGLPARGDSHESNPVRALATILLIAAASTATAVPTPIDLNSWSQRGSARNGNWVVAADGSSVLQSINGNPTFFVAPTSQINTTIRGSIRVETSRDDDYIGFVFGFNGPAATGSDMDFMLFDWKQGNQSSSGFLASEGFALSRVDGTITNFAPGFWGHTDSAGFSVLATDFGTTRGWADNTTYDFEILYQASRIKVAISGGAFGTTGQTIFDIAGSFPDGQFGFYNFSQPTVRYAGLTEEVTPPSPPPNGVPEPATLGLLALGLVGVVALRRRRIA